MYLTMVFVVRMVASMLPVGQMAINSIALVVTIKFFWQEQKQKGVKMEMAERKFEVVKAVKTEGGDIRLSLMECSPIEPELATGGETGVGVHSIEQLMGALVQYSQAQPERGDILIITIPYETYITNPVLVGSVVTKEIEDIPEA